MPVNMSRYRDVKTWEQLKPELVDYDLAPFEAADVIPQLVTKENVYKILDDIRMSLEPGYLTSLGELVRKFDLSADFTKWEERHLVSFLDEHGHLVQRFVDGALILREVRSSRPELLPATSDHA